MPPEDLIPQPYGGGFGGGLGNQFGGQELIPSSGTPTTIRASMNLATGQPYTREEGAIRDASIDETVYPKGLGGGFDGPGSGFGTMGRGGFSGPGVGSGGGYMGTPRGGIADMPDYLAGARAENQLRQDKIKSGELVQDPTQRDQGPPSYVTRDEAEILTRQRDAQMAIENAKTPEQIQAEVQALNARQAEYQRNNPYVPPPPKPAPDGTKENPFEMRRL